MTDKVFDDWWKINGHVVCGTKSQNYFVWVCAQKAVPTSPDISKLLQIAERVCCEIPAGGRDWELLSLLRSELDKLNDQTPQ